MKFIQRYFILSCVILTYCTFQARPLGQLPPSFYPVYLQIKQPYSELSKTLRQTFHNLQIPLSNNPSQAGSVLEIIQEEFTNGPLAESENSKIKQYWLSYRLLYRLKANALAAEQKSIFIKRIYTVNEDQVLGSTGETTFLRKMMIHEAVYQLITTLHQPTLLPKVNK